MGRGGAICIAFYSVLWLQQCFPYRPGMNTVKQPIYPTDVMWENNQYKYTTYIRTLLSVKLVNPSGSYTLTMFASNAIGVSNGSFPFVYQYPSGAG